jgi:hypothetical protein
MQIYVGMWLSWESAAFARQKSRVRIPSSPPLFKPLVIPKSCRRFLFVVAPGLRSAGGEYILAALPARPSGLPIGLDIK